MPYTSKYGFWYASPNSPFPDDLDVDERRWRTVDTQSFGIYSIFGNGVREDGAAPSWQLKPDASRPNAPAIAITSGRGHVNWTYCFTTADSSILLTIPPGVSLTRPLTFYVYAKWTAASPERGAVQFFATTVKETDTAKNVCLGTVTYTPTNSAPGFALSFSSEGRVVISLFSTIARAIKDHHHTGGATEPAPVVLATETRGKLSGDRVTGLDAGAIEFGTLRPELFPQLDHDTDLSRNGTLPHAQLESLLAAGRLSRDPRLHDLVAANLLRHVLAVKRQGGDLAGIDSSSVCCVYYVPQDGSQAIEADPAEIPVSTPLAIIDRVNRHVRGGVSNATGSDQVTYTTAAQFTAAAQALSGKPETRNVEVLSSGAFTLTRPVNYESVSPVELTDWKSASIFFDKATRQPASPPTRLDDDYDVTRFVFRDLPAERDWRRVQKLGVSFGFDAADQPGRVLLYLLFADGVEGGADKTVMLTQGGQERKLRLSQAFELKAQSDPTPTAGFAAVPLSAFGSTDALSRVTGVALSWDTTTGWTGPELSFRLLDPDDGLLPARVVDARVNGMPSDPNGALFVWNEDLYADQGEMTIRFDAGGMTTFASIATDTSDATRTEVTTRVAELAAGLAGTPFLPLVGSEPTGSVTQANNQGNLIEVRLVLEATEDLLSAPVVDSVSIAFFGYGTDAPVKEWSTAAEFTLARRSADGITVVSGAGDNGSLALSEFRTALVGRYTFLQGDETLQLAQGSLLPTTFVSGGALYPSLVQRFARTARRGLLSPRDMVVLPSGNIVVADTANDRVVEMTSSGGFVRAIQGNLRLAQTQRDWVALAAFYNPRLGQFWLCFSQNITAPDRTKIVLSTANGLNTLSLANATGATIALLQPDASGRSATVQVVLTEDLRQQVNAWSGIKQITLLSGAVTLGAQATGSDLGGGDDDGGDSLDNLDEEFAAILEVLAPSGFAGELKQVDGLAELAETSESVVDYDGDGAVSTRLLGPGGQVDTVVLGVDEGEIVFDSLLAPLSVQVTPAGDWVVAHCAFVAGVTSYAAFDLARQWRIGQDVAPFRETAGGNACVLAGGNVLLGLPGSEDGATAGALVVVNRQGQTPVPVLRIPVVQGDVVRAVPAAEPLQYWAVVDDRVKQAQSQVVRFDSSGSPQYTWGLGTLIRPTSVRVLESGDILVSE